MRCMLLLQKSLWLWYNIYVVLGYTQTTFESVQRPLWIWWAVFELEQWAIWSGTSSVVLIDCDRGTNKQTRHQIASLLPLLLALQQTIYSLLKRFTQGAGRRRPRATERAPATFLLGAKLSPEPPIKFTIKLWCRLNWAERKPVIIEGNWKWDMFARYWAS